MVALLGHGVVLLLHSARNKGNLCVYGRINLFYSARGQQGCVCEWGEHPSDCRTFLPIAYAVLYT